MTRRSVPVVTAAASVLWTAAVLAGVGAQAAAPVRVVVLGGPVHAIWYVQVSVAAPSPARLSDRRLQVPPEPVEIGTAVVLERRPSDEPRRATRSLVRKPSTFVSAPHTHAGLVAWLATLRWPWQAIATCESVRDDSWRPGSRSWARGVFQFLPSTWRSLGRSGDPADASWRDQLAAAEELEARDGLRAWDCARILGIA